MSDAPAFTRHFLALWPDAAARDRIAAWRAAGRWPAAARPLAPGDLHLTLHFLGTWPPPAVAGLIGRLDEADCRFDAMTLVLDRAEVWAGGIAVLRPSVVAAALADLHGRLAGVVEAVRGRHGLPPAAAERRYRPHVTLARRAGGAVLAPLDPAAAIGWTSHGAVLAASLPAAGRHGGARYRVLHRF